MVGWDPLSAAEQAAVAEEVLSALRHDLRNRFAIVRNASFYIKRRIALDAAYQQDPRIEEFFAIIDEEVVAASARLEDPLGTAQIFERRAARVSAAECARRAAACARVGASAAHVELQVEDGDVEVDALELAVAIRCLLEIAVGAMAGGGVVLLRGAAEGARYLIEVTGAGLELGEVGPEAILRPVCTTKPGHLGLGLNIAQRVARRYGGALVIEPREQGSLARIELPLAAPPDGPTGTGPSPSSPQATGSSPSSPRATGTSP